MRFIPTAIPDVLLIEPVVHADARGFLFESFNRRTFLQATGLDPVFVQDNHSVSVKGVLRGLHFQVGSAAQGKLVRVVRGAIYDVAVDIRPDSPTFGKWVGENLSAANRRQLWVPRGFAHGYLVLSEEAELIYKTDNYYCPESERAIIWSDPDLGVSWPILRAPLLSERDSSAGTFSDYCRENLAGPTSIFS